MRYLDPLQIVKHGMGVDGLRKRARLNLSVRGPYSTADCTPHESISDVWICATGDGHDAARLLIADQLADGPAVAWVPHRDRMLFTRRSPKELGAAAWVIRNEAIRSASRATHPITAEAFMVQNGVVTHLPFVGLNDQGRLDAGER